MDNKKLIDFCSTPRVDFMNKKITNSTPFLKNNKLSIPEFKFEESLAVNQIVKSIGTNITTNSTCISIRERSVYSQPNINQIERLSREFELLKLKFLNQNIIEITNKNVEIEVKKSVEILDKKRDQVLKLNSELETKKLLIKLKGKVTLILNCLNDFFPNESLDKLDEQLKRYKKILLPNLESIKFMNLKNDDKINGKLFKMLILFLQLSNFDLFYFLELFEMVNKQQFFTVMEMYKELNEKQIAIKSEKLKRIRSIDKIKWLFKELQNLVDLIECLSKKDAL